MSFDVSKILTPVFFQIIGTVILFGVIFKFTYKSFLEMIDKREKHINDNISSANLANEEAQAKLEDIDKQQKDMIVKKDQIISEATRIGEDTKNGIINQARDDAKNIVDQAHREVEANRQNVEKEIMANVYDYVSLVAKKYVSDNLDKDKEQSLISAAVEKVSHE